MDSWTDDPSCTAAVYGIIALGVSAVSLWLGRKMLVVVVPVVIAFLLYAAIAIPGFLPARPSSLRNACVANLRHIQSAKMEWARSNNRQATDTPGEAELIGTNGYLRILPRCPKRGDIYTFGPVGQNPTCTLSNQGHRLQ